MIKELVAENLIKHYGPGFTLNCNFSLKPGVLYTLLGPNGSGKSTLLRILCHLERPDSGEVVLIEDKTVSDFFKGERLRKKTVLVPTESYLFSGTVFDNIAYGLKLRGIKGKDLKERVYSALKASNLEEFANKKAKTLSSGMAQRVALTRALVLEPEILFLDEPTVNLDPDNTYIIEEMVKEYLAPDRIVLFVTHNIFQAKRLADKVLFMYDGKIIEMTDRDKFFSEPQTQQARSFLKGEIY